MAILSTENCYAYDGLALISTITAAKFDQMCLRAKVEAGKRLLANARRIYSHGSLTLFLFGVLTIIAFTVALQQFYIINYNAVTRYSLFWHIPFNLFYFWYWFLVYPVICWLASRRQICASSSLFWILSYLVAPSVLIITHQLMASAIINLLLGYSDLLTLIYKRMIRNPWIGIDLVIYLTILAAVRVADYQRTNEVLKLRASQLHGQLVRSRLNALESQLHPHFLFNTLNTLSTLILRKDNAEARRMLSLLQDFLRITVYGGERHEITLEEELRFVNQYLEIEKVRFSDKLEVSEEIDVDTLIACVPSFLLQPIVENAIRHAIAPKSSRGILRICTRKEEGRLMILVEDDGPGLPVFDKKNVKEGVGLKIAKERLDYIFGEAHSFTLGKSTLGGLKVEIRIPFLPMSTVSPPNTEVAALELS